MPEIRKGQKDSEVEGGKNYSGGDGGNVNYVKNKGTSDHVGGGVQTSRKGLNKVKGKT